MSYKWVRKYLEFYFRIVYIIYILTQILEKQVDYV